MRSSRLSLLAVSLLLPAVAVPSVAAAATPVCTPSTCTDLGKTRSVTLKRSGSAKVKAKAASTGKKTSLRVNVKFAPKGSKPRVTVTGPRGFKKVLSKSRTFRNVRPGSYVVSAEPVAGNPVTTFASYGSTRAKLRKGVNGWVGVRYTQQVQSTTRVASSSAIETVAGDPNGVRDVVVEDPQALVQPGTVLAAGVGPQTPGGLLVAVDSVTRSGDKTIARGGPAPLTAIGPAAEIDAAPELTMSADDFQKTVDEAQGGAAARAFKRTLPGFSLENKPKAFAAANKGDEKGFDSPLTCNTSATANFEGDVSFKAGTEVGIAWGGVWKPLTIQAYVGVRLRQDAKMLVTIDGEAKCELELDLLPKDHRFSPWTFSVGPVPVVIVPKLNFQLTGEASVGARLATYVEQSLDTSFGVQWDGERFGPYGKASATFKTTKPQPSGTLNVKAAIGPKLMFDFYDVAGPYLTADLFLQLKADTKKDPWWRLSGGLQAGGGLRFKVWKFNFDKGIRDIWSEDWTIAKADKPPVPAFTTTKLADAENGKAYNAKVAATSSRAPLAYTVNSGRLPAGLKLDEKTGAITGTATGYGTAEFEVAAKDSLGQKGLRTFKVLTKTPPAVLSTTALPAATVGAAYSAKLEASGAVAPYQWTASALPAGLRLAGDTITGTPTALGTTAVTVTVRGLDGNTATRQLALAVNPAPLAVTTGALATGKADTAYSQTLTAAGGRAPYTWAAGTLPAGLTLSAAGVLEGTPTEPHNAAITVTVTDADGRTATGSIQLTVADVDPVSITTATLPQGMSGVVYDQALAAFGGRAPYTWSVTNAPAGLVIAGDRLQGTPSASGTVQVELKATDRDGRTGTKTLALEILAPGISITTSTLPTAAKDEAYDQALTALGGTAPYTWALETGTLPAGLTLDPATGHISGTPTTVESQQFTVKVTSSDNATVTKQLTLAVANLTATPLDDVSCPTANFCLAVDRKAKAYTRTASTDWSAGTDMAGVPQSSMYQNRVSCTSETFCIYLTNAGKAAQFDGTTWTRLPDLPAAGGGTNRSYWDIDCVSPTNCVVAAGKSTSFPSSTSAGYAVKWDGTAWSSEIGSANINGWTRVSCPVADDCMLTSASRWGRYDGTTVTGPTTMASGGRALDCISMTECFTGTDYDSAMRWNGTAWAASAPDSGGETLHMSPIGCAPTGTFCAAGGNSASSSLWTYSGSSWTKGPSTAGNTSEVGCGSSTFCVATTWVGTARTWDGSTWTLSSVFARG